MDNGSITSDSKEYLSLCLDKVKEIFGNYKFELQQFVSSDCELQSKIDAECGNLPGGPVSVFGHKWNHVEDTLYPNGIELNKNASTKRECLSSLNGVYDLMGVYTPILLRARLFLQELQSDGDTGWDSKLSDHKLVEWSNICNQANRTPPIKLPRCVGSKSEQYCLLVYTDASRVACGSVAYLRSSTTSELAFWGANSKLLCEKLKKKSIPCLELLGIVWGLEYLLEIYNSLAGDRVVEPIIISGLYLFTDSTCCLHWIEAAAYKFEKQNDKSVFVRNKLKLIDELCQERSIIFVHARGRENPADVTTRPCTYRALMKSNFITGPRPLLPERLEPGLGTDRYVVLPNLQTQTVSCQHLEVGTQLGSAAVKPGDVEQIDSKAYDLNGLINIRQYSSFFFLVNVLKFVLRAANILLHRVTGRKLDCIKDCSSLRSRSIEMLIASEQRVEFAEILSYLTERRPVMSKMPPLVGQLNLYIDELGLLRVKSKFGKFGISCHPIILPKSSFLTEIIIIEMHSVHNHCGAYHLLKELRTEFYVVGFFSLVQRLLRRCVTCRRFNARTIKLNQSDYRKDRMNPETRAFAQIYLDHAGPFKVRMSGSVIKVWLLIITCMWSRAVNILICRSLETSDFLKALQAHIYLYGIFSTCVSDLGSQLTAGARAVKTFLDDEAARRFFEAHDVKPCTFDHYPKGNSALGSIVEVCVKQVKSLIQKSIRNVVLDYFEFEHLILKTNSIVNKRPIAFKPMLSELASDEIPSTITPEMLIKGYETRSLNVVPGLQKGNFDEDESMDYVPGENSAVDKYRKLREAKERLVKHYHGEFLNTLIVQAIDKKDRYKKVKHEKLQVGDIVLLVEHCTKRYLYPMGRVQSVESNDLDEVTAVYIFKGASREVVYRHVTSVILLLSNPTLPTGSVEAPANGDTSSMQLRSGRKLSRGT